MKPSAHLLTWPTGNVTAVPGPVAPCYRGVRVDPLFKDPGLFDMKPNYDAAAETLCRMQEGSELADMTASQQDEIRGLAKAIVDAALGIK